MLEGRFDSDPAAPISPREIELARVTYAVARSVVVRHHYLPTLPSTILYPLGAFARGQIVGCLCWAQPNARAEDQRTTLELVRMVLSDQCARNSESRALGVAARLIARDLPHVRRLIAYSDLDHGHEGGIYAASGWTRIAVLPGRANKGWESRPTRIYRAPGPKAKWERVLGGDAQ